MAGPADRPSHDRCPDYTKPNATAEYLEKPVAKHFQINLVTEVTQVHKSFILYLFLTSMAFPINSVLGKTNASSHVSVISTSQHFMPSLMVWSYLD